MLVIYKKMQQKTILEFHKTFFVKNICKHSLHKQLSHPNKQNNTISA